MNEVTVFNNPDFGEIRTIIINGEPYFVGIEVAKALGYAVPKTATAKHVDSEDRLSTQIEYAGQNRDIIVINESGLYALIFGSKLESAKKFKKWVTSEVLPSIRKTGGYKVPQTIPEQIQLLAQGNVELNKRVDALDKKLREELMNLPLLGVESDTIDNTLKHRGVEIAGGKESNAYKDKNLLRRIYWDLHGQLRREFGVSTYKAIKRSQTDLTLKFLAEYHPPLALKEEIQIKNAQQTLNFAEGMVER